MIIKDNWKTLKKDGKYVELVSHGNTSKLIEVKNPKLISPIFTIESFISMFKSVDFTGVELVPIIGVSIY